MKALSIALILLTLQAQAKVLVVISDSDYTSATSAGISLHEVAAIIGQAYLGRLAPEFATPNGNPVVIAGTSLQSSIYSGKNAGLLKTEIHMLQQIFGRVLINPAGVSPATKTLIDKLNKDQDDALLAEAHNAYSLKKMISLEPQESGGSKIELTLVKLEDYNGLIILGGPEALETFPLNSDIQALMRHFQSHDLPMGLSGYGQAALGSSDSNMFAGYVVAAAEPPSKTSGLRLDRILLRAGIFISSSIEDSYIVSDRQLLTGQQAQSIDKLLEAFIPRVSL